MSPAVCPECRVDKHDNCDGGAWDFDTDAPTVCACAANEHDRSTPLPTPEVRDR